MLAVGFTPQDMEAFRQLVETVLADAGMGIKGIHDWEMFHAQFNMS